MNFNSAIWFLTGAMLLYVIRRYTTAKKTSVAQRTILVTGASSGIGREIAKQLAARGASLILVARRLELLEEVCRDCQRLGAPSVVPCTVDLTSDHAPVAMLNAIQKCSVDGNLFMAFFNAGLGGISPLDSCDMSGTMQMARNLMEVNYFANVRAVHQLLPRMCQTGRLVFVSSVSGVITTPNRTLYCASKFALQGFCNALRTELRSTHRRIGVTVACPGLVRTEFHEKVLTNGTVSPKRDDKGFMSSEECARQIVEAAVMQQDELIMTWSAWLGYLVRPLFPRLVDDLAARKAAASVKH